MTKLFASGGFNSLDTNEGTTVEVIDISGQTSSCIQPAQLDFEITDSACLLTLDGNPLICGGFINESTLTTSCFEYTQSVDWQVAAFSMISERRGAAYAELMDGKYWIFGGIEVCSSE